MASTEILEAAKTRLKNPYTGSYAVSWLLWNWKVLIYLSIGDASATDRIKSISNEVSTAWSWIVPFFMMLLHLFAIPLLTRFYYQFARQLNREQVVLDLASEHDVRALKDFGKSKDEIICHLLGVMKHVRENLKAESGSLRADVSFTEFRARAKNVSSTLDSLSSELMTAIQTFSHFEPKQGDGPVLLFELRRKASAILHLTGLNLGPRIRRND